MERMNVKGRSLISLAYLLLSMLFTYIGVICECRGLVGAAIALGGGFVLEINRGFTAYEQREKGGGEKGDNLS